MNTEQSFKSKIFKWLLFGIAGLIILFGTFRLGTLVGFKKAGFSYRWEENYGRNFGMPRGMAPGRFPNMMRGDFPDRDFINPHGAAGQVLKISSSTMIIKGNDNIEKTIIVGSDTKIQKARDEIKITDVKVNDNIMVIGAPDSSGQIEAKFIRVF